MNGHRFAKHLGPNQNCQEHRREPMHAIHPVAFHSTRRVRLNDVGLRAIQTVMLLLFTIWPLKAEESGQDLRSAQSLQGVIVSEHPLASAAGVKILREGGNAVDAAIATGLALAVTHPAAGNIGGGGFIVLRQADGTTATIDFREIAPAAATADMFLSADGQLIRGSNHQGMRSVGVPGTIAGFALALQRFGTKSWSAVSQSAIELARDGFPLSDALAEEFAEHATDWRRQPAAERVFLKPDGSLYVAGDCWQQPDLAQTLQRLVELGPQAFYTGHVAKQLADGIQAEGGLITADDLAAYRAQLRAPVRGRYHDLEIISMSAPSSGGATLIQMLKVLEGFDLPAMGHQSAQYVHTLAETMQLAFRDRARYLGDPDADPRIYGAIARMISDERVEEQQSFVTPDRHSPAFPRDIEAGELVESPQTTHYSVIDAAGNAVAVTYTLEQSYGSRLIAPGLGFLLNNEMGDFNPWPGVTDETGLIGTPPNQIAPRKRMLSSMTPTIVLRDGRPWLIVGSPGGRTIINTVLQVLLNTIDFQMSLSDAVAAARFHHQWLPDRIQFEQRGLTPRLARALTEMGHKVETSEEQGRVMAILIDGPTRTGVADLRAPTGAAVPQ